MKREPNYVSIRFGTVTLRLRIRKRLVKIHPNEAELHNVMYTIMVALLNGSEHLRPVVVLQAVCRALLSSSLESQNMRFNTLNTLLRASNLSFWATKSVSFWATKSVSFCKIGPQILDPPP